MGFLHELKVAIFYSAQKQKRDDAAAICETEQCLLSWAKNCTNCGEKCMRSFLTRCLASDEEAPKKNEISFDRGHEKWHSTRVFTRGNTENDLKRRFNCSICTDVLSRTIRPNLGSWQICSVIRTFRRSIGVEQSFLIYFCISPQISGEYYWVSYT